MLSRLERFGLIAEQKGWISNVRDKCADEGCIEIVAPARILTAGSGLRDTLSWGIQLPGGEP
jgi:hypothetical protein